jgi:ribose transport system permease protein
MLIVRGAAFKYTDARTITGMPPAFGTLSTGLAAAVTMIAVFVIAWIVLSRTPFGRHVYAVGGNLQAAWLSGVRVTRVQLLVYATSGLAAGLAGVLVASRLNAGYPRAGEYYELDAIAAVVVGGTSLFGGRGSIWGTLAGAFFIGILNNALNLYQVSTYDQMIVKGAVLLAATSLDRWRDA